MHRLFSILLLVVAVFETPAQGAPDRPNLLFVFIDDMGYADLGSFGGQGLPTAHIDRMASEGIRLTQFYVASPICSPSRVGVTTGQFPSRHGVHSYLNSRERNAARSMANFLDPSVPCIARTFKQAGYATAHFGKWHMGGGRDVDDAPLPQAYGFDESLVSFEGLGDRILPPGGLSDQSEKLGHGDIRRVEKHEQTGIYVDRSIDFIRRHQQKPFYLHLWLNDVHDAHKPRADYRKKYDSHQGSDFDKDFLAVLDQMDQELGRLFQVVDDLGLAKRTLIVITSDNGPTAWPRYYRQGVEPPGSTGGFRGRKWSLYEGGIRMPFIARWPGVIPAGATNDTTVMGTVDFFPTFCAIAGIEPPAGAKFDGENLAAALKDQPIPRTKPLIWEYGRDDSYLRPGNPHDASPNLAIRDGDWKLLINADGSDVELYNLAEDPRETVNWAPFKKRMADRLSKEVLDWRNGLPKFGDAR